MTPIVAVLEFVLVRFRVHCVGRRLFGSIDADYFVTLGAGLNLLH
jgi:hypothetical protein